MQLTVRFSSLSAACDDIQTAHKSLVQQRSDLDSFLAPLRSTWQSPGGESWQTAQNHWNQSADDLIGILRDLFVALDEANYNYALTENQITSAWNG